MSISNSLSNALSGMTASARMAEVVSSNVSNALTEGYGRRSLNLSSGVVAGRGAGVEINGITRHMDQGILADRRLADARLGANKSLVATMSTVQDIIGKVDQAGSLADRIVSVEAAIIDAASDPASVGRLSNLNDRLQDLTTHLNLASKNIQIERQRADTSISAQVDTLNNALSQLERLNADVAYSTNTGGDPSGLIDARQNVIDKIAELVPVRTLNRENGRIALMTPQGEMLIDGPPKVFGFIPNPVITSDMTLAGGGLSGLTRDGNPIASDGIGRLGGGTLGASFQARDVELTMAQSGLDEVAADLILRFESSSVDPTILPGQPGLLTDDGAPLDAANIVGLSGRISVNASIDPNQGGEVFRLRDGLYAVTQGLSGDSTLLSSLGSALAEPRSGVLDTVELSAVGRAGRLVDSVGNQRTSYESEVSFEFARWTSLREAEAAEGVDTDYEMQMLLRIEQAYSANARVIQTVNSLMQRLMEI